MAIRAKCAKCGEVYPASGEHRCKKAKATVDKEVVPHRLHSDRNNAAPPVEGVTYKYRDPDKRRAQVREAMKRYRSRKKLEKK